MNDRWKYSKTCVFNIGYHLIWCTKYRRKLLNEEIQHSLKELLFENGNEIKIDIEQIEVMPDHVHLFVKAKPIVSPHWIVQQLKGYTSRLLRIKYDELKTKVPTLWTRSYYCESVGHISEDTIRRYIQDQKNK